MRFLEGWVLDGPGQDVVSLMKDCMARCELSGRISNSRKYGLEWLGPGSFQLHKGWHRDMGGSGRMATSRNYGPGVSGPGYG